jgi:hypothetical protein
MKNNIDYLVLHCSVSEFGDVELFRRWHVEGNGWSDIGYNAVILNGYRTENRFDQGEDGLIEEGRSLDFSAYIEREERGAHVLGYNGKSIGICLVGNKKFTVRQIQSAVAICRVFKRICPTIMIAGHYEMPTANGKTCPNIDMGSFRQLVGDSVQNEVDVIRDRLGDSIK